MNAQDATTDFKQVVTFMNIVEGLSGDTNFKYHVLDVAQSIEEYIYADKNPTEALDFLLSFYQALPAVHNVIRSIIIKSLSEYNNYLQNNKSHIMREISVQ